MNPRLFFPRQLLARLENAVPAMILAVVQLTTSPARAQTQVEAKLHTNDPAWKTFPVETLAQQPGFKSDWPGPPLSIYGGDSSHREAATGFFHTAHYGDRWWLVDPSGARFIAVAMNAVSPGGGEKAKQAFQQEFHSAEGWATETTKSLRAAGFNTLGNWSNVAVLRKAPDPLPYCAKIDFLAEYARSKKTAAQGVGHTAYKGNCLPVFDADFPAFCDTFAKKMIAGADDPYLLGYFTDNELPPAQIDKYLALDPADPDLAQTYRGSREWFDARHGKDAPASAITAEDKDEFTGFIFDRYYAATTVAVRKYDPHHLCLGSRFYSFEKCSPAAFRAAGRYLDIVSVNDYGVWSPTADEVEGWTRWSGKPVMITEWYAKGMDSGLPNLHGAGWTVKTQRDRGLFYQTFCLGLLRTRNCVGWHWFKYQDNDPADLATDPSNRDSNKGMLRIDYQPYAPLVEAMTQLNRNVYQLRP